MRFKDIAIKSAGIPLNPITGSFLKRYYASKLPLCSMKENENIVVMVPHVDDETIGLGGTIRAHVESNSRVHVVLVTDGSQSVSDLTADELKAERRREMEKVKKVLGIQQVSYLDLKDGGIVPTEASNSRLKGILETEQPDIIYTNTFIDAHPDHTNTSLMLADMLQTVHLQKKPVIRLYEINCPIPPEFINCVVNVSKTMKYKKKAITIFSSQAIAFDGFIKLNKYKRHLVKKKRISYAEAFIELDTEAFIKSAFHIKRHGYNFKAAFKQANRTETLLWAITKSQAFKKEVYRKSLS
ncbi:LmbE family N-acetylglucosaminyl deacetylase [Sinobaca qinghaiensis]|uniref:LmbE family N-acetylglucosaminyl deacetylase n=1 Tax=Sinobaca qinghaiensis TaxID=342944 RepID=A0A419V917_9BACL|nr:PIG-L family deacetylase [Sinobaca qinghaiensis]RKD76500.1 LmbE family N-acetylglucosaminyl deacetylase [Sinobaca qinghaiensis]